MLILRPTLLDMLSAATCKVIHEHWRAYRSKVIGHAEDHSQSASLVK